MLVRPLEDEHAGVLALLADGESWSSSAIALALGAGYDRAACALFARKSGKKSALSGMLEPGVGWRPPRPDSRRHCYSRVHTPRI